MKMQLISLTLENFKCHERLEIHFDGRNAAIYGQNAVGKSSIYDGLTWLLFGKDSHGKKDFDIKPLTLEGSVKDHAAITAVEAVFRVDGTDRKLKRTYYEVWSTKRGSAESSFDGHSSDYFVDDVPCKKGEFARRVGEIINENAFRLLTSLTYFPAEMPWQERRATLFDVVSIASDTEIMASDPQFAPLVVSMQGLTMDDYRKKMTAQRKGLLKVRTDTPARLDECKKTVTDLSSIDFAALGKRRDEAQEKRTSLQRELDQVEHDGSRMDLQNKLVCIRNELGCLENENAAYRLRQKAENGQDRTTVLRQSLNTLRVQESRCQRDLEYLRSRHKSLDEDVASCRKQWDAVNAEQFQGGTCPTCGQPLPQDKLEESKAAFDQGKDRRKRDAVEAANRAKSALEKVNEDIAKLEQEVSGISKQTEDLTSQLKALEIAPAAEIKDMDNYAGQKAKLTAEAADIQNEIDSLDMSSAARRKALRDALADADKELSKLSGELSKKTALEYANKRMTELREQAAAASDELNKVDQMLFLCEEFMRYKAKFIEESINRRFSLVRFRLFKEQINGGLEDCCDVTVGGVPYSTGLNSGAKVNACIDIINTLSRHYNAQVPLFVDNAESVTRLEHSDTQVIRLIVSENDKELRCDFQ